MTDICMIPAYKRPECLTITLDLIAKNNNFKDLLYLFILDYGFDELCLSVIEKWVRKHNVEFRIFTVNILIKNVTKQSHCLFSGYKKAYELTDKYVFMVEEDVAVSNRFFEWHYKIHQRENIFCSTACRSSTSNVPEVGYNYYIDHRYHSLGVCFPKKSLPKILIHANNDYYNDHIGYVGKKFPNSRIGDSYTEQDGIIFRVIEKNKLDVAFPTTGLAYHYGFYGKNRGVEVGNNHTLDERISLLKNIIFSKSAMRHVAPTKGAYEDSKPVCLELEWDGSLSKIQ